MANRFSKYLSNLLPRTGRIIREDGLPLNQADAMLADPGVASLDGTLYRGFWEGSIPGNTTYDFVIDIPAGLELFGFTRTSTVQDESLSTRFLSATGFTSAQGPIDGLSFDRRTGRKSISQCKIHRASSLSGVLTHSPAAPLAVTTATTSRVPSIQTEAGAIPAFDENEIPAFRYVNATVNPAQLKLYLFWREVPVA